tara:strand:+ start:7742 stop:8737 length:996 start_codon:yes stop_codon:yes gene_type:complete
MNYKSYILENNPLKIKEINSILFYGENVGLKKSFKEEIKKINNSASFINFTQEEILTDKNIFYREQENSSLFAKNKIIFVENCNDKILGIFERYIDNNFNFQTILFSDLLDKRSKLRNKYDKSKNLGLVACYPDNKISIQKKIMEKLKNYKGLNNININLIIEASSLDTVKLHNEITKIETYFLNKEIETQKLSELLNATTNEDFGKLKDEAINGNKINTNKLLDITTIDVDKSIYYIALLNQRLNKLKEIFNLKKESNLETTVNNLKPPIFWKDKPIIIEQMKKWNLKNINEALDNTYKHEIFIKKNSNVDKRIMVKKLVLDICNLANAS